MFESFCRPPLSITAPNAIANTAAAARHIHIEARFDPRQAELLVVDDGRGFDRDIPSAGFGLTSMRERAAQIGAALRIESEPSAGTLIGMTLPLQPLDRKPSIGRAAAMLGAIKRRL